MPTKPKRQSRTTGCPIATSLDIFGDRWSLLVVRDLMFKGFRSFKEFADSGERIATNVLAERLARLEAARIIERRPDPADGRKTVYRLTSKGIDLAPMMVEMVVWAARHEKTDAPPATVRQMETNRERFLAEVRRQWEET
jgi:DNA-binding HxlR family transcriptional regulator